MKKKKKTFTKKIIKWFWVLFTLGIFSVALIFFLIAKGYIGYMPPIEELENPIDKYASQVISADMKQLGTYAQSKENRIFVNYEDLSPDLVNALIATEDIRFTSHSGIDAKALLRAIFKRAFNKNAGGGSTITQQLAKQLYSPKADNIFERLLQKPIEWVIAVQLERFYTKEEIINLYLNKFDFLNNAVGIQSASRVYFGKTPKELNLEEAATLIGMCKNPSYYNPVRHAERSRERRNMVISLMAKNHYISDSQKESFQELPLKLNFHKVDHKEGLAPYFREYLRLTMTAKKPDRENYSDWQSQKFSDDSLAWATNPLYGWCNKNRKADGSYYNLYVDGLKIYTTINSKMQVYAEDAVREHIGFNLQNQFFAEKKGRDYAPFARLLKKEDMEEILARSMRQSERYRRSKNAGLSEKEIIAGFNKPQEMTVFSWKGVKDTIMTPMDSIKYMKSFLRSGLMAMDPRNGEVKAYVGGIDYQYFQYDMINSGRRQIGSTMKPYLYALAMEEGVNPCDEILHVQPVLLTESGQTWEPRNSNRKRIGEMVSVKWGLQNSDNWITASLMEMLSPYTLVRILHSFGIKGYIDPVVSLCLGPCDISISEMVSGYSTFANQGVRVDPVYVTRIEDSYGNIIATFTSQMTDVLTENSTYKMLDMLQGVIDGGTGGSIRRYGITAAIGGKTGTTQNNSDGWFMAFTPSLVTGVWVGGEDRSIHFDRMDQGQSARTALPVFALFMKKVYDDQSLGYSQSETFDVPVPYRNSCSGGESNSDIEEETLEVFEEIFE